MTSAQKIIKYCALGFAGFLIINIIGGILFGIFQLGPILGLTSNNIEEVKYSEVISTNIQSLEIDLAVSVLEVRLGNEFKVQYSSEDVKIVENKNKLKIEEKRFRWFQSNRNKIILTIPENTIFTDVTIDAGTGSIYIEELSSNNLSLNLGVGKTNIDNLNVTNLADIDGGVGSLEVNHSKIYKLDLNIGVGKTVIKTILERDSTIDAGVGEIDITLLDELDNYKIYVDKGIGKIKLNNEEIPDESTHGAGSSKLNINGGVGSINIYSN